MTNLVESLLSRTSCDSLTLPIPNKEQLHLILSAAMRAPDHGRLRPWRYLIIPPETKQSWIESLKKDLENSEYSLGQKEFVIKKFASAPLIIALAMRKTSENTKISLDEQLMAVSAAAMNILNMIHILGFAAKWVSGPSLSSDMLTKMGLNEPYRLIGFLYVGTPTQDFKPVPRVAINDYIAIWKEEPISFKVDQSK